MKYDSKFLLRFGKLQTYNYETGKEEDCGFEGNYLNDVIYEDSIVKLKQISALLNRAEFEIEDRSVGLIVFKTDGILKYEEQEKKKREEHEEKQKQLEFRFGQFIEKNGERKVISETKQKCKHEDGEETLQIALVYTGYKNHASNYFNYECDLKYSTSTDKDFKYWSAIKFSEYLTKDNKFLKSKWLKREFGTLSFEDLKKALIDAKKELQDFMEVKE